MNLHQKILNKIDWIYNTFMSKRVITMTDVEVLDFDDSVASLIKNRASLARFGDGELSLMLNGEFFRNRNLSLRFQRADPKLKQRLLEVMNDPYIEKYNLKLAISGAIKYFDNLIYTDEACHFWKNFLIENRYKIYKILRLKYPYIDTLISRFYMDYRDKRTEVIQAKVFKLKQLWNSQELLIVEGWGSRLGLNNSLFDNVISIQRIVCPSKNAFDKYDQIFDAICKYGKDKLIILALGPTATVLAYDLAKSGYWAMDLGHIDIEYEWFLMGAEHKVKVEGKIMTEVLSDQIETEVDMNQSEYNKQILFNID